MADQNEIDWIDHYGFILVAFAHMTDWYLAESELQVISDKMEALFSSCTSLKKETWFDNLASVLLLENLAEIAEADHKIDETEIHFLKNIADVFGVNPPKI